MHRVDLAVIGGTGLYDMDVVEVIDRIRPRTPYGPPSDEITVGRLHGLMVAFLPRHGRGHRLLPSEIPYRANVFALKQLGATRVVSLSAVGSLSDRLKPMDIAVPDQIVDKTWGRPSTFFGDGVVAHVEFSAPVCATLRAVASAAVRQVTGTVHDGGTYVCMEGPAFSSKAESLLHRSWGMDVIGMTAMPEAKLVREAEMCYCLISLVTDYDAWHETEEPVSADMILTYLRKNAENAKAIISAMADSLPAGRSCSCGTTLSRALVTDLTRAPFSTVERLRPLLAPYLKA
ncbi:S-methyl-5'-thioadenosine phosphorylase [Candidatus Fermentibacteria bacterium]|nr:S-methyl-5'-thioadenosine phosphorylase [Candidatus Fermentibacteria bacterium]